MLCKHCCWRTASPNSQLCGDCSLDHDIAARYSLAVAGKPPDDKKPQRDLVEDASAVICFHNAASYGQPATGCQAPAKTIDIQPQGTIMIAATDEPGPLDGANTIVRLPRQCPPSITHWVPREWKPANDDAQLQGAITIAATAVEPGPLDCAGIQSNRYTTIKSRSFTVTETQHPTPHQLRSYVTTEGLIARDTILDIVESFGKRLCVYSCQPYGDSLDRDLFLMEWTVLPPA